MLAAYTGIVAWLAVKAGRKREALARQGIDPKWAQQAEGFIRELLDPPADGAALDDMVVLPRAKKEAAKKLLYAAPGAAEQRAQRRATTF